MSLHLPHFKCFLFPRCVSLSLGSLPPSQLIVHHLTIAFLGIIYCVLNSIICTNVSASIFHGTLLCLRYTWIKVLRCGICWPSFWSKKPAVYSWRFSGITGTALLVYNKFSMCALWINTIVISLCVCHIQTGVKSWVVVEFWQIHHLFVCQWVHHLVAEFAEWDVFNIAPTNQWSSRYSLSMWNQGATKHHSQSTYTGVFWGGCVCLHSCWLRSSLFAMLFRNNQWSDSR